MTCRKLILFWFLFLVSSSFGQQYVYVKGANRFEVTETARDYKVICKRENATLSSKNRNILDRQLRLDAVDLIGAYILFKTQTELPTNLFQIYVKGVNLHYNAYVEGLVQKEKTIGRDRCVYYECKKEDYKIESATYNKVIDIPSLLEKHYAQNKGEASANLLYEYEGFTSEQYVQLEHDFLTGETQLPQGMRLLQNISDRFELTVFSVNNEELNMAFSQSKSLNPSSKPYMQFFLEELVTSAPLAAKADYYRRWQKSMSPSHCLWEDVLLFCSRNAELRRFPNESSFSNIIAAFPGAVSPFGIRQPINNNSYLQASQAYASSDFKETIKILTESIDIECISPQSLNLLGASYRFNGNAKEAMPYLLLCFKLNPETPYLVGNITLCLEMMKYPKLKELLDFLNVYAKDEWSRSEIVKIKETL